MFEIPPTNARVKSDPTPTPAKKPESSFGAKIDGYATSAKDAKSGTNGGQTGSTKKDFGAKVDGYVTLARDGKPKKYYFSDLK